MLVLVDSRESRKAGYSIEAVSVAGVMAVKAELHVPSKISSRRFNRLICDFGREVVRAGNRVVFSKNFQYRLILTQMGIKEMRATELIYEKSADIVNRACIKKNRILLCLNKIGDVEKENIKKVVKRFRYIDVMAPDYIMDVVEDISNPFGAVPVAFFGSYSNADSAIFFSKPNRNITLKPDCAVLNATGESIENTVSHTKYLRKIVLNIPERFIMDTYPPELILSYALEINSLEPRDVTVVSSIFAE